MQHTKRYHGCAERPCEDIVWTQLSSASQGERLKRDQPWHTLMLHVQPPELWDIGFLLFKSLVCAERLGRPEQMGTWCVQTKENSESHLRRHLLRFLFSSSSCQCPSGAPLVLWAFPSLRPACPRGCCRGEGPFAFSLVGRANLLWQLPVKCSCVENAGVNKYSLSQENISWGKSAFVKNFLKKKQLNSYITKHELQNG